MVDELVLNFTHDLEIKFLSPGILPIGRYGRYAELPHVVVMKFKGSEILHEHNN